MRIFRFISMTLMVACALLANPATAQMTHIRAALISESLVPASGSTVSLALAMVPDEGWHGYWKNPGDAGMETLVKWTLPRGVTAGPLVYPVPTRLMVAGIMNYVYEGPYAHLVTLAIPPGLAPGTKLPIRADVDWLACTDTICVPERDRLALDLVVGDGAINSVDRARFDGFRQGLPKPVAGKARFEIKGGMLRLGVPFPSGAAIEDPWFFPHDINLIDHSAPERVSRTGDMLVIETKAKSNAALVGGVVGIGPGVGLEIAAEPGPVPAAGEAIGAAAKPAGFGLVLATFGAAVLGGLLLNIMPCVFPILSLKALSLARASETAAQARRDGLAYAAGVILVCVGLGVLLLALRSGGAALGWAFQLQDPRVILVLLLLVTAIGFNMAGLFELPMLSGGDSLAAKEGAAGAFWTGALAAFIATPCTGPFMAGALGAALILPPVASIAIFVGLGLGLALPFLALGFVPALRRMLPRPGAWMQTMRHILALPMFATALGLAWILGRQAGVDAMALGLGAMLLVVGGLWWIGQRQSKGKAHAWWPLLPALVAAAAIVAAVPNRAAIAAPASRAGTEAFSEARLDALRKAGRPVFLYFTADWCLTCKVNEKAAIERAEVGSAFAQGKVAVLVGDWTRGDPAIGRFLSDHGRSGVPFYLFYPKAGGDPQVLPQILTPSLLIGLATSPPTP